MLNAFKHDLLLGYRKLAASNDRMLFREVNTGNGYLEDSNIVMDYTQFIDGFTVFAVIPELMAFARDFALQYANDLYSISAFQYLFNYLEQHIEKYP